MKIKEISRWIQSAFYLIAGANHFLNPEFYLRAMPEYLPYPSFLHLFSGVLEMLAGIGLVIPKYSTRAAWLIIIILIAVFPANLEVALKDGTPMDISPLMAWLRLPFQLVFIAWAYWYTKKEST
jgi:uncharacterized membrane protein